MANQGPFWEQEKTTGAVFGERFGVEIPEHFGDPAGEYEAVRTRVGLVDLSFRGLIEVKGADRFRWLNAQITSDVKQLRAGVGKLAAALNVKGHVLADLAIYGLVDSIWVDINRDRVEILRGEFDRHIIADDVVTEDASGRHAHLMLVGPEAKHVVAKAMAARLPEVLPWHHFEGYLGDTPVRIIASRWLAMPSFDVILPVASAGNMWDHLVSIGRNHDLRPAGMKALEILRIEAGWPWYGVDFDDSNLLMEALTQEHVSFTKGCYIGQEVVIRIEHRGHLAKKLSGLVVAGEAVPSPGATILSADRQVGNVTSAVFSLSQNRVVALGYLRREFWDPGIKLHICSEGQPVEAEVVSLPFISSGGW